MAFCVSLIFLPDFEVGVVVGWGFDIIGWDDDVDDELVDCLAEIDSSTEHMKKASQLEFFRF